MGDRKFGEPWQRSYYVRNRHDKVSEAQAASYEKAERLVIRFCGEVGTPECNPVCSFEYIFDEDWMDRIIACVNACEGMDDPEREVSRLKHEDWKRKGCPAPCLQCGKPATHISRYCSPECEDIADDYDGRK